MNADKKVIIEVMCDFIDSQISKLESRIDFSKKHKLIQFEEIEISKEIIILDDLIRLTFEVDENIKARIFNQMYKKYTDKIIKLHERLI